MMSPSPLPVAPLPVLNIATLSDGSLQHLTSPVSSPDCHSSASAPMLDYDYSSLYQDGITAASLHEKLTATERLPERFCNRLVGLHFGKTNLELNDLTEYMVHLEKRFYTFARSLPEFQALSEGDQQSLLMANSSMYVQLHLARYISAGNGLSQIRALLGDHTPDVLAQTEPSLLTLAFPYFSSVLGLFGDKVWSEFYETNALKLCRLDEVLSSQQAMGQVAACILFYRETQRDSLHGDDFDDANAILHSWMGHARALTHFCSMDQIKGTMDTLRSLSHFYSSHANKHNSPKPCLEETDDLPWLREQLTVLASSCQDLSIGSEDLIHLCLACTVDNNSLGVAKSVIMGVMRRRVELVARISAVDGMASTASAMEMESGLRAALNFLMDLLDSCESGHDQLDVILGRSDRGLWGDWFSYCTNEVGLIKKMGPMQNDEPSVYFTEQMRDLLLSNKELITLALQLLLTPQTQQRPLWKLMQQQCKDILGEQLGEEASSRFVEMIFAVKKAY